MSEQEDQPKGFKVTDRRSFAADGSLRSEKKSVHSPSPEPQAEIGRERQHDAGFVDVLSLLATQASLALGEPNPITGESHEDLQGARILISMIEVLAEKTQGNLTSDEASALESTLYALRMGFVTKSNVNKD